MDNNIAICFDTMGETCLITGNFIINNISDKLESLLKSRCVYSSYHERLVEIDYIKSTDISIEVGVHDDPIVFYIDSIAGILYSPGGIVIIERYADDSTYLHSFIIEEV